MTKSLKTSFILALILSGVVIAWRSLMGFMGAGVGLNFVAMLVLTGILLVILLTDSYTKSRFFDIFVLCCVFVVMEFLVYFIFEFNIGNVNVKNVFYGFQNVYSILGIFLFAYIVFRFIIETKQLRLNFVESILGNNKKAKKSKELENGSLAEKPNSKNEQENNEQEQEEIVIEKTEE